MYPYQNLSLQDMPGEIWKDIPGWEGVYQVSNLGRVKSLLRGIIRKQHPHEDEYPLVTLVKGKSFLSFSVHRLVASLFVPNPDNKPAVDHINGDRRDNKASNLRWATTLENCRNPITVARKFGRLSPMKGKTGAKCPLSKPIYSIDSNGNEEKFWGVMEAKQRYNYDPGLIKRSLRDPQKHKAYKKQWYYL